MSDAILERRYRRLLTCYPVEHRRVYGEEMIGVLLASTPKGQRRPALTGGQIADPSQSAYLVLLAVQALALTVSPGPAHALTLITAKNAGLAVPWLLGAAYLARVIPTHYPVPPYVAEIGIGLIALAALPALATRGGRRLFVIIGLIPLSALVTTILTFAGVQFYALSPVTPLVALYLPPVALATLTCLVAKRAPGVRAGVAG